MSDLKKTPLYELHVRHQAKLVAFAGYQLPLHYAPGIINEHLHTRAKCGLFDVSHMGVIEVRGADAAAKLETLMPVDLQNLATAQLKYALLTNPHGGIRDDLMLAKLVEHFMLVVNAAGKHTNLAYLRAELVPLEVEMQREYALLALQGPSAAGVLRRLGAGLDGLKFLQVTTTELAAQPCLVSRSGYSGEDGFEIGVAAAGAPAVAAALLADPEVALAGLGARDTLRLEAGLCLYGQDLDQQTTPYEAGLHWAVSPARRRGPRAGGFPGSEVILAQSPQTIQRKRVGLKPVGRAPVRAGCELVDQHEQVVGGVTSGGFSPSLRQPLSMGYVRLDYSAPGQQLVAMVRGRKVPVVVSELPFVPPRYVRG